MSTTPLQSRPVAAVRRPVTGHRAATGPILMGAAEHCLRLSAMTLESGHLPGDEEFAPIRDRAAEAARSGTPIEQVLAHCHRGMAAARAFLLDRTPDPGPEVTRRHSLLLFSLSDRLAVVSSGAYVAQCARPEPRGGALTPDLVVDALLSGRDATSLGHRHGIRLAENHLVVALAIRPRADEDPAVRRGGQALGVALTDRLGGPLLASLSGQRKFLLLPGTPTWTDVESALQRAAASAGVEITAAAVQSPTSGIPDAAEQAQELLVLAGLGAASSTTLHGLADLALEYQLTRPGPGRDQLVGLLDALSPELIETLRVHLDEGVHRQRTARRLHLHANSVDYRLRRIAQLTGRDPGQPMGLWTLRAAIVVSDYLTAVRHTGDHRVAC
ncbi:PucR family transcriptional regulator [Rhodococcus sp. D2-41]|uniref:Helix-turn-helix domain-containing protein n=1 Tax=Speluncibacter jeojiensis TaxID=2710754 RepID=A0A9X4LXB5_9ACTN|nr:helix-turn-helix domain-containing protein [Rhodococcus sp. D2-41]MDG3011880.1 PucR family transcriptional regulator [Rhodococcus sp. D2-41]MDG3013331.1 helix-turn-helix domain-containing protein [Corynebacteriales bacterium D3-21]